MHELNLIKTFKNSDSINDIIDSSFNSKVKLLIKNKNSNSLVKKPSIKETDITKFVSRDDVESILIGPKDCVDELNDLHGIVRLIGGEKVHVTGKTGNRLQIDVEQESGIDISDLADAVSYFDNPIASTDKVSALRDRVNALTTLLKNFYLKNNT